MENHFGNRTEQSPKKHLSQSCELIDVKASAAETTNTSNVTSFALDLHTFAKCPRLSKLWHTAFTAGQERRFSYNIPPQK